MTSLLLAATAAFNASQEQTNTTTPSTTTTTTTSMSALDIALNQAVAYISLLNIIFGVTGNLICFLVFVLSRELRRMSFIVYLTYCSIANILSLFEWNLNHYLAPIHGFTLEPLHIVICRLSIFMQYFSQQCSAYFLSWMCIDRYVSVIAMPGSFVSRLPFSTAKTAHFWSLLIIVVLFALNSHILILNGYYEPPEWRNSTEWVGGNGTNRTQIQVAYLYYDTDYECGQYSATFNLWPLWDVVNLYVYTVLPFAIMMTFNVLLIIKTLLPNRAVHASSSSSSTAATGTAAVSSVTIKTKSKAMQDKARLTKSLLAITISFLVMTVPVNIAFGYFVDGYNSMRWFYKLLDCLAFAQQSVLLINCFVTNNKFRRCIMSFLAHICFALRISKRKPNRVHTIGTLEQLSLQKTNQNTKTSE